MSPTEKSVTRSRLNYDVLYMQINGLYPSMLGDC